MDILELIAKFKLGQEGEDKAGFDKEFRETFKHKSEISKKQEELDVANKQVKELSESIKKFDGVDVDGLKQSLKDNEIKFKGELEQVKLNSAIDIELLKSNVKNSKAVRALLDPAIIKLDGEKITGLKEQIENLKKSDDYLFGGETKINGITPAKPGADPEAAQSNGALFAQSYNSMFSAQDSK